MVYLFLGPIENDRELSPADADLSLRGDQIESASVSSFGVSVAALDDLTTGGVGLVVGSGRFASEEGTIPAVWILNMADLLNGQSTTESIGGSVSLSDYPRGGGNDFDEFTRSLDGGDFNGDGVNDVTFTSTYLSTRPNAENELNGVCIYYGPMDSDREITDADFILWNDTDNERWATAIRLTGDINGDGYDDILGSGEEHSKTFLGFGAANKNTDQFDPEILIAGNIVGNPDTSEWEFDYFGRHPEYIGDRDGDGSDDIAVGASGAGTYQGSEGATYVFEGLTPGTYSPDDATLTVEGFTDAQVGTSVAGMGDLFGDGSVALLVGSRGFDGDHPSERVGAWLYGDATGKVDVSDALATFSPGDDDESAALQMVSGDMDGDGLREAVILNDDNTLFIVPGAAFVP